MSLSTKVLFFCFSSLLLLPCQKTLVFRFFSINSQVILKNSRPLASNFSILLSNLLKKSQYKSFTTRKQQQLGENKNIRLWSTGNSYFKSNLIILHINRSIYRFRSFEEKYLFTWVFIDKYFPILFLTVKFCDKKYL